MYNSTRKGNLRKTGEKRLLLNLQSVYRPGATNKHSTKMTHARTPLGGVKLGYPSPRHPKHPKSLFSLFFIREPDRSLFGMLRVMKSSLTVTRRLPEHRRCPVSSGGRPLYQEGRTLAHRRPGQCIFYYVGSTVVVVSTWSDKGFIGVIGVS